MKEIKVNCNAKEFVEWKKIKNIQGKLKNISRKEMSKLKLSIVQNGFSFPFYIWMNDNIPHSIDGIHRQKALLELESEGNIIPKKLPCVTVNAGNIKEAKELLLLASSKYAEMSKSGLFDFVDDLDIDYLKDITSVDFNFDNILTEKDVLEEMHLRDFENYDYLVFVFKDYRDYLNVMQLFNVKNVNLGFSNKNKKIGLGRVIDGEKLLRYVHGNNIKGKK